MKTLRISDKVHRKLTVSLGTLMAQIGKTQTYQDTMDALLKESLMLSPELLAQVENFIEKNKHFGYTTKEVFIRDAIRFKLIMLSQEYEYIEISKEQYDQLNEAAKEMNMPHYKAADFINAQIKEALEKYPEREKGERTLACSDLRVN